MFIPQRRPRLLLRRQKRSRMYAMKFPGLNLAVVAVLVLLSAAFLLRPATTASGATNRAVVVELFTSEGCSSCPPADELLTHLRQDLATKNIQVVPLGFHVDYWNSLG